MDSIQFRLIFQTQILQQHPMINPSSLQSQRKTFLSPEHLPNTRTIHSPKFDRQKAHQNHIKRKIIYEQKLARYDQYNAILSAKVKKELQTFQAPSSIQNNSMKNLNQNQFTSNQNRSDKFHPSSESSLIKGQNIKNQQNQKNLPKAREKNQDLHAKKAQLKSYLKKINSGVSQLQCILQEVQSTYHSLKKVNPPQFKGLWLMNDLEQKDDNFKSEKYTKDTGDFDYDRTATFQHIRVNERDQLQNKNLNSNRISMSSSKLQAIDELQRKFKHILQRITKREMFEYKIDAEMSQLSALERQIDELKKSGLKSTLNSCKSQKTLQFNTENQQKQQLTYQALNKVKSLGRIIN